MNCNWLCSSGLENQSHTIISREDYQKKDKITKKQQINKFAQKLDFIQIDPRNWILNSITVMSIIIIFVVIP